MKLKRRKYKPGDEVYINKLYKLITNIDRSLPEYEWEWLNTWNGQGSIWLLFDEERKENGQLIGQYSLIPAPFSIWGESYLAGKTENCMSHPDYRGKGIYFPHEKKYFKEAQEKFQLFFTTAGNAAKGTPGAVRRKLGYVAFDSWIEYIYCTNSNALHKRIYPKLESKIGSIFGLIKLMSIMISKICFMYTYMFSPKRANQSIKLLNENNSPINEIEALWNRNKTLYGITVDRTSSYLNWRINQNPYCEHKYLLYYKDDKLIGYIIFKINDNVIRVVDILAENKDQSIFKVMIDNLIIYSKKEKIGFIICSTLKGNKILKKVFHRNGFIKIDTFSLKKIFSKTNNQKPFHVFISKKVVVSKDIFNPENWYVTGLVTEGRS